MSPLNEIPIREIQNSHGQPATRDIADCPTRVASAQSGFSPFPLRAAGDDGTEPKTAAPHPGSGHVALASGESPSNAFGNDFPLNPIRSSNAANAPAPDGSTNADFVAAPTSLPERADLVRSREEVPANSDPPYESQSLLERPVAERAAPERLVVLEQPVVEQPEVAQTNFEDPESDRFEAARRPGVGESNPGLSGGDKGYARAGFDERASAKLDSSSFQTQTPPPTPEESETRTVPFGEDDSWWTIAERHYGDGRLFRALFAYNEAEKSAEGNAVSPPLQPGSNEAPVRFVRIPELSQLITRVPDEVPADLRFQSPATSLTVATNRGSQREASDLTATTYQTRRGDTLFDIARRQLGQASRYVELYELNRDRLPATCTHLSSLPDGIELELPRR